MKLFKPFLAVAILAIGNITSAKPVQQVNEKTADNGPVPRVHTVSPAELALYQGISLPPASPLKRRWTFGDKDDRKPFDATQWPYTAIKQVVFSDSQCTASAIGPRHLLTAKHCFPTYGSTSVKWKLNDQYGGGSHAVDIIVPKPDPFACPKVDDFAIIIFDKPIFTESGYFGVKPFDCAMDTNKAKFENAGYYLDEADWTKAVHQDRITVMSCDVCSDETRLVTDADVNEGQSGGPLYRMENGIPWLYGVASAHLVDQTAMYVTGSNLVNAVAMARQEYP